MKALYSFFAVIILIGIAYLGITADMTTFFGVFLPYIAAATFIFGVVYRIIKWAKSPVPFKITTTCGQQKSLPWIKNSNLESPHTTLGVIGRMALEVLFFRSLFRNTKMSLKDGPKIVYGENKWLWLAGLVFHWSFLIIVIRHLRFFFEPVPEFILLIQSLDGLIEIGVPVLYMTGVAVLLSVTYLYLRRALIPQINYISLVADYFPLFLIMSIVITGGLMRYTFLRVDIVKVKELTMGLASFNPAVPEGIGVIFFIHLFLISVLLIYFPMSKLMHMAGIFMSPTRNMKNDNRMKRHINPWNYPVDTHSYEDWEDEFRDVMKEAGLPLEKE